MGHRFRMSFLTLWGTVSLGMHQWCLEITCIGIGVSKYNESRTVTRVFYNSVVYLSLVSCFLWDTIIVKIHRARCALKSFWVVSNLVFVIFFQYISILICYIFLIFFIHSLKWIYLQSTHYVPDTILGTGERSVSQMDIEHCCRKTYILKNPKLIS